MEFLRSAIDLFLNLDKYLNVIIQDYGAWTYAILFFIIFAETGLVIMPFLPGDSLLFAAGALAGGSGSPINVVFLYVLLLVAAIGGDTVNYWIGHRLGQRVFNLRFLNKEHLLRTQQFYEKHGGKTIILARFIPIIRTFAPFVAGMGSMNYSRFISYNVIGGFVWITAFLFGGYLFGQNEIVEKNFGLVVVAIILISVAPAVVEFVRHRMAARKVAAPTAD